MSRPRVLTDEERRNRGRESVKRWREANPEYYRDYYRLHKDEYRVPGLKYRHSDKCRVTRLKYRQTHKERIAQSRRECYAKKTIPNAIEKLRTLFNELPLDIAIKTVTKMEQEEGSTFVDFALDGLPSKKCLDVFPRR